MSVMQGEGKGGYSSEHLSVSVVMSLWINGLKVGIYYSLFRSRGRNKERESERVREMLLEKQVR